MKNASKAPLAPADRAPGSDRVPIVFCIVLNWNGWHDTLHCLSSLQESTYPRLSVIVVDNGSTDGSEGIIRSHFPSLRLIQTGHNLGFSGGVNSGIRVALASGADYVWLLNNDAIVAADALSQMVQLAESDHGLGAVGSVLYDMDHRDRIQAWGGGTINLWLGLSRHATTNRTGAIDYLTAASILIRSRALREVGLFDEGFFLYCEDTDLSLRLKAQGWKLTVATNSTVWHREHASTGNNRRAIDRYTVASCIKLLRKHAFIPWLSITLLLCSRIFKRIVFCEFARIGDIAVAVREYRRREQMFAAGRSGNNP